MYATMLNNKAVKTNEPDEKVNESKPKKYKNNHNNSRQV